MIDLYGVLQEQETVNGELGLGVDYYKGNKAYLVKMAKMVKMVLIRFMLAQMNQQMKE